MSQAKHLASLRPEAKKKQRALFRIMFDARHITEGEMVKQGQVDLAGMFQDSESEKEFYDFVLKLLTKKNV